LFFLPQVPAKRWQINRERSLLLDHPLASEFLTSVERWIGQESMGTGGAQEFAEMRSMAIRLIAGQVARGYKR
jgi:hypothetical protein